MLVERCPSGLKCALGKRVWGNPPQVQILSSPPIQLTGAKVLASFFINKGDKMRDFEKISFEQFKKDVVDDKELYNSFKLPHRNSTRTAGYDIYLLQDATLKPGEIKKFPTGLKARFEPDEVLLFVDRSSTGFKYNIRMCNQLGIIDADYYNCTDNEGHMWYKLQNEGGQDLFFPKGTALIQAIFMKYLTTDTDRRLDINRQGKL